MRLLMHASVFGIGMIAFARTANAQIPTLVNAGRPNATRQELERQASDAEAAAATTADAQRQSKELEATAIRARLRDGDFRAGDRIVVAVRGDSAWSDTVVVLSGPTLSIPSFPDDSLRGVLRSELQPHLSAWAARYYRNISVRAIPLIRFGVLGEVNHPGYYRVPADMAVSDAIMSAGGPTQRADMTRAVVRRSARSLLSRKELRDAIAAGMTLDQLGFDAGDELVIGSKPERNWMGLVQVVALITGVALSVHASRGF